jgi:acetamidase/formamidase
MQIKDVKVGDSIKVHITATEEDMFGGESVWAEELGNNTARINNLPFFVPRVGFNDIIRYEIEGGIREFKEVITKVTDSWGVTWEPTDKTDTEQTTEEWHKIADHLKSNDVHFEAAMAGMFVIALPVDKEEENIIWLKALKYSSPIALVPYFGEDEEED